MNAAEKTKRRKFAGYLNKLTHAMTPLNGKPDEVLVPLDQVKNDNGAAKRHLVGTARFKSAQVEVTPGNFIEVLAEKSTAADRGLSADQPSVYHPLKNDMKSIDTRVQLSLQKNGRWAVRNGAALPADCAEEWARREDLAALNELDGGKGVTKRVGKREMVLAPVSGQERDASVSGIMVVERVVDRNGGEPTFRIVNADLNSGEELRKNANAPDPFVTDAGRRAERRFKQNIPARQRVPEADGIVAGNMAREIARAGVPAEVAGEIAADSVERSFNRDPAARTPQQRADLMTLAAQAGAPLPNGDRTTRVAGSAVAAAVLHGVPQVAATQLAQDLTGTDANAAIRANQVVAAAGAVTSGTADYDNAAGTTFPLGNPADAAAFKADRCAIDAAIAAASSSIFTADDAAAARAEALRLARQASTDAGEDATRALKTREQAVYEELQKRRQAIEQDQATSDAFATRLNDMLVNNAPPATQPQAAEYDRVYRRYERALELVRSQERKCVELEDEMNEVIETRTHIDNIQSGVTDARLAHAIDAMIATKPMGAEAAKVAARAASSRALGNAVAAADRAHVARTAAAAVTCGADEKAAECAGLAVRHMPNGVANAGQQAALERVLVAAMALADPAAADGTPLAAAALQEAREAGTFAAEAVLARGGNEQAALKAFKAARDAHVAPAPVPPADPNAAPFIRVSQGDMKSHKPGNTSSPIPQGYEVDERGADADEGALTQFRNIKIKEIGMERKEYFIPVKDDTGRPMNARFFAPYNDDMHEGYILVRPSRNGDAPVGAGAYRRVRVAYNQQTKEWGPPAEWDAEAQRVLDDINARLDRLASSRDAPRGIWRLKYKGEESGAVTEVIAGAKLQINEAIKQYRKGTLSGSQLEREILGLQKEILARVEQDRARKKAARRQEIMYICTMLVALASVGVAGGRVQLSVGGASAPPPS